MWKGINLILNKTPNDSYIEYILLLLNNDIILNNDLIKVENPFLIIVIIRNLIRK